MKKLLCICAAAGLFASCSKSSSPSPTTPTPTTPTIPADGWTLNGTSYKQKYGLKQTNQVCVTAADGSSPVNVFAVFFKTYPTASGTYHVVALVPDSSASYPGQKLADNEVVISATLPSSAGSKTLWSMGYEKKDVTITVTNGKIKAEVPEVALTSFSNDTSKVTGTIKED